MRGPEGLSQYIIDPSALEAVVDTSISHLPDHLHVHQFSPDDTAGLLLRLMIQYICAPHEQVCHRPWS